MKLGIKSGRKQFSSRAINIYIYIIYMCNAVGTTTLCIAINIITVVRCVLHFGLKLIRTISCGRLGIIIITSLHFDRLQ